MIDVSVIIPTYNYGNYILDAINSVLTQNYTLGKIEIIVIDDGSTDSTEDVLKPLIESSTIQYYYQQNKGKANATSLAIQKCQGKYICNLDADDYFFENKISEIVKVFEADQSIVHVSAPAKFINQDTGISGLESIPKNLINTPIEGIKLLKIFYNNNVLFGGGSTYTARATTLKAITIPDNSDMYIDELLILAVLPFGKSYFLEKPLSVWRIHNSNYSGTNSTIEYQIKKEARLLASSFALLKYLKDNDFDDELINIYTLQHQTRSIVFKEISASKNLVDIARYTYKLLFEIRPNWNLIKKYHVINRLVPLIFYKFLKNIKYFSLKKY